LRFLIVLLFPWVIFPAEAQDWPGQKQIHILVGFAPGSTTDLVARLVAPKLGDALGQVVLVENKGGAGGNVATQQVKRLPALPDVPTVNEEIVDRLNSEINRALSTPDVAARLAQLGLDWHGNTSGER